MASNNVTLTPASAATWLPPTGITLLDSVEMWGGGGSGASTSLSTTAGGGGGGGAYSKNTSIVCNPAVPFSILVGQGGAAGSGNANGNNGANTTFTHSNGTLLMRAEFGQRGLRTNVAGAGGTTGGVGATKFAGGAGAAGVNATGVGGGGGAGACNAATGAAASGNTGGAGAGGGGTGGEGGLSNANGTNGAIPGAGGGGSGNNTAGTRAPGTGANGSILITWTEKTLSGVSRDKDGYVLPNTLCYCFKYNGGSPIYCGSNTSNGSGVYTFTVSGEASDYFVVFFKDDATHIMDVTDHVLAAV